MRLTKLYRLVRLFQAETVLLSGSGRTAFVQPTPLDFFPKNRDVLVQPLANVNALRATRPVHERHAPTLAETQLLLQTIRNENGYPTNLIARMLYGCGLRVSEPLNLRIKDVDVQGHRLCIRGAKGGNDRVVPLPLSLAPKIVQQMQSGRVVWKQDKQNGTPLMLPHGLARKYPEYQFS